MTPRPPPILLAVIALGVLSGVGAYHGALALRGGGERWQEIAWPFPRDGWPAGRAFRCEAASCGGQIELYVRPKLGFCSCDRGVADDDEVDRVTDVDLLSERFAPSAPGEVVRIGEMAGRSRSYELSMPDSPRPAIGIAVSRRCDVLVAVVQGRGDAAGMRREALDFLQSGSTRTWLMAALNGLPSQE